jgi:hypothetical protein
MPDLFDKLKNPYNFIKQDESGKISNLYCKGCGVEIAGTDLRPFAMSGPKTNVFVERFMRRPIYCEAKFQLDKVEIVRVQDAEGNYVSTQARVSGGFHVVNGCRECLRMDMDLEVAQAMYLADLLQMGQGPLYDEKVIDVVAIDRSGSGVA